MRLTSRQNKTAHKFQRERLIKCYMYNKKRRTMGDVEMSPQRFSEMDLEKVKEQCEKDWRRLKSLQADLTERHGSYRTVDLTNPQHHIMKEHEKRLKAELMMLKERKVQTLPESKSLQELILRQDQKKRLEQLQETLTFLRSKRSEVQEEIKLKEESNSQLQRLNEVLKAKVAAQTISNQDESATGKDSVVAVLSDKVKKVTEKSKHFKRLLIDVLGTHFPKPRESDYDQSAMLNDTREINAEDAESLRTLIGQLVEQSLNYPSQPYVTVDDSFWPPYLELMLRSRIVSRDPQNSNRIKLKPFHL